MKIIYLILFSIFLMGGCPETQYADDSQSQEFLSAFETNTKEAEILIDNKLCVTLEGEKGGCTIFRKTSQTFQFKIITDTGNGEVTMISCNREITKPYVNGANLEFTLENLTMQDDCDIGIVMFSDLMAPQRASILGSIHLRISELNFQKLGEIGTIINSDGDLEILSSRFTRQLIIHKNNEEVFNQEKTNHTIIDVKQNDKIIIRAYSDLARTSRKELTVGLE